jgi:hypothetical protein
MTSRSGSQGNSFITVPEATLVTRNNGTGMVSMIVPVAYN